MTNKKSLAKLLRFATFAALLVGGTGAALVPDWATTLKAQGYSSYVDLQLALQPSVASLGRAGALKAGANADFLVSVANAGPDDAHAVRAHAQLGANADGSASSGCAEDPLGFPDCTLASLLAAGDSADYLLTIAVSPLARGHVNITVAVDSADNEAAPADNMQTVQMPVEAHVDLQATSACARSYVMRGAPLACRIVLSNAGSAASAPELHIDTGAATVSDLACDEPRLGLCPTQVPLAWTPAALMMPGDAIDLSFTVTIDAPSAAEDVSIYASAHAGYGEIEDNSADNSAAFDITVPIFRDGFEIGL
jgi:hypothetical protein